MIAHELGGAGDESLEGQLPVKNGRDPERPARVLPGGLLSRAQSASSGRASEKERQERLIDLLDQLCTEAPVVIVPDEATASRYLRFFKRVYLGGKRFRHRYSGICHLIYEKVAPYEDGSRLMFSVPDEVLNLLENLNQILTALVALRVQLRFEFGPSIGGQTSPASADARRDIDDLTDVIERVTKLHDHVSLEVERLQYMVRQNRSNSEAVLGASEKIDEAVKEKERQLKDLSDEVDKTKRDVQRDNIAVLGIFASVVLVVNSAVSFSSASISAIGTGRGVVPVLLMAAIVGYVVINAVGVMLAFVWRMTFKDEFDLGEWPEKAWRVADAVLVALIVLLSLTRLPWFRALVGLPV